ncbi:DUF2306 domain-containing protein [Legionella jordanis]|nr:DUF2306 domain-containing protein [Legionella jordanis]RMX20957.1 DUF2306 domain-containing protein [Legionella jordanis]HAT8713620.1 DUF2306 domain-containing protein [Legionella jordanis]
MRFNVSAIMITVWGSLFLFGLYIFIFYLGNALLGKGLEWNQKLPELYDANGMLSTAGISLHFLAGSIILILGFIQFSHPLRLKFPWLHRLFGKTYITASLLAGIGGLIFIFTHGTIGGYVMDIGFAGYGILMIITALQTLRFAKQCEFSKHRIWALRLFSLAIASWLYRMDYGFWFFFTNGWGHTKDFHGSFDLFMAFFFYLPNLVVIELMVRSKSQSLHGLYQYVTGSLLACANAFIIIGTYTFLTRSWWPAILKILSSP